MTVVRLILATTWAWDRRGAVYPSASAMTMLPESMEQDDKQALFKRCYGVRGITSVAVGARVLRLEGIAAAAWLVAAGNPAGGAGGPAHVSPITASHYTRLRLRSARASRAISGPGRACSIARAGSGRRGPAAACATGQAAAACGAYRRRRR